MIKNNYYEVDTINSNHIMSIKKKIHIYTHISLIQAGCSKKKKKFNTSYFNLST